MEGDKIKILLVDDDREDYLIVRANLRQGMSEEEFMLHHVYTYQEALKAFEDTPYDVCLFDYLLGSIDGLELLKEIRKKGVDTPVIFLTGQGDEEIAVEAMKAGASDYLLKSKLSWQSLYRSIRYAVELFRAEKRRQQVEKQLHQNIERARRFHQQFLPGDFPKIKGLSLAAYYHPAWEIGGDFYNILRIDNKLLVYITDVTGHGFEGALLNVFVREAINSFLMMYRHYGFALAPGEIIRFLAKKYYEERFPEEYFICILLGILDLDSFKFTFANAGFQLPPLLGSSTGEVEQVNCGGLPITRALNPEILNYEENAVDFRQGETMLLATDGIYEEMKKGAMYGVERLKAAFAENSFAPAEIVIQGIKEDFKKFKGTLQGRDDITLLVIQRNHLEKKLTLELANDFSAKKGFEDRLRSFLADSCTNIDEQFFCINELINNAIEHGGREKEKKVIVDIFVTKLYVLITVEDQGKGFNWREHLARQFEYENEEERGRGIAITKMLAKKLFYNDQGNKAFLVMEKNEEGFGAGNDK